MKQRIEKWIYKCKEKFEEGGEIKLRCLRLDYSAGT